MITFVKINFFVLRNNSFQICMKLNLKKLALLYISVAFAAPFCFSSHILGIKGEDHTSIGLYIKDLKADTVVFEHNAKKCMVPASITKLLTSATAMSLLGNDYVFETKVYLTGSSDGKNGWNGDIVIKASGDPTIDSEYFPQNPSIIKEITQALKAKGISRIKGEIVLERVNEAHQYQEGPLDTWNIDDVCWAYGCGIFDFNWGDNFFGVFPATGRYSVPVDDFKYTVWDEPWGSGLNMIRGIYSDSLIISGKKYTTDRKARINTAMPYPFDFFKASLKNALKNSDIEFTSAKPTSSDRKLLLTHKSPRLENILRSLMLRSDNMFAEGVLRKFGERYGDRDASLKAEKDLWESRGLDPQFNRILDGSGLSRANAISPEFFGKVLEWMAKSGLKKSFVDLFPVAGESGTMKSYLAKTPLKGRLAVKTGSVNAVQTYAGYLTDDAGEPTHVVVIMINNFYCSRSDLRDALQVFLLDKFEPWLAEKE